MNILHYLSDKYYQIKERDFFLNIFQSILFLWILSIPLKNSLYQLSTVLLILIFIIHFFYYKQKTLLFNLLKIYKDVLIIFILFLISMSVSTLIGFSEKNALFGIFKYFYRYIFIFIVLLYFYKHSFFSRQWLLAAIFIVLLVNALDGIYQYITGFDFIVNRPPDGPRYLLTGAVYQHNPFGLFMAIGAIMSLVLFFNKNNYMNCKYDKLIYFISLLIFLFTLFHSQSRAAWVMFGIFSIGYLFIYLRDNGFDKKLFFTLSSLLIMIALIFLTDDNLSHRLTLLLQGNSSGRSSAIWPFAIDKIINSPILGYGIDTYKFLSPPCCNGVHNLSLELLLYTGIIGFSILYYLVWLSLKESFTTNKIIYFILFLSYIVLLQFDGSLIDSKVHLNIFIVMLFFIYSFRLDRTNQTIKN